MRRGVRRDPGRVALVAMAAVVLAQASACTVSERYLVERSSLAALAALPPPEQATAVLPATRTSDGKPAWLRARDLPVVPATAAAGDADPVPIATSARAPRVTAGAVLTIVGSVCSIVGTSVFLATLNDPARRDLNLAFGILELTAEPEMIAGTILWVRGLTRPPQEARPQTPGLHPIPPSGPSLLRW